MPNETGREYKTLVTTVGKNKIAAAVQGSGKVNITQAAVGNGGGAYYVPTAEMAALVNEVWRGDIANKWINDDSANMVDVKVILPADVGGFTVREAALFDADGDMIAICNMPDTEKAVITTGTLTIIMHIMLTDADVVEFTVAPYLDVVTAADVERQVSAAVTAATLHRDITIPASGWFINSADDADIPPDYNLHIDIPVNGATVRTVPQLTLWPTSMEAANTCELCQACKTTDGALRVYAKKAPTEDLCASLLLFLAYSDRTVTGGSSGNGSGERLPDYEGATSVLPSFDRQVLPTKGKSVNEDIEIQPIQVTTISNPSGGDTISI